MKTETKTVRHDFTPEERNEIGGDLARAIATARGVEEEFDEVKAAYKAKLTSAQARIGTLSTSLMNGFELRAAKCRVVYRPKDRKKDFFLVDAPEDAPPVLTEDMEQEDYAQDLIQAESKFENREEIQLFNPAAGSSGTLVVGRQKGRWFSALRITVGHSRIEERLDSEQKSVKARWDAVRLAGKRAMDWLTETLGAEAAKGFKDPIQTALDAHREREE